jgi:hypothetical protein
MSTEPSTVAALPNANSSATALPVVTNTPAAPAKKAVRKVAKKATVKKASVKAAATKKAVPKPVPKGALKKAALPKSKTVVQPAAEQKLKKPKLVRDSFTFPKDEYQAIAGLKQKAFCFKPAMA